MTEPDATTLLKYQKETPNEGIIRYTGVLGTERVLLVSPEVRKHVFVTHPYDFLKPFVKKRIGHVTGNGLIVSEGDVHKVSFLIYLHDGH